jgi:hypothetical protein
MLEKRGLEVSVEVYKAGGNWCERNVFVFCEMLCNGELDVTHGTITYRYQPWNTCIYYANSYRNSYITRHNVSLNAQTFPRLDKAKDCRTSEVNVHAIPLHATSAGATGAIITYTKVFHRTLT